MDIARTKLNADEQMCWYSFKLQFAVLHVIVLHDGCLMYPNLTGCVFLQ